MKIKLNTNQIEEICRELKESDRKDFDISEVADVFRMLQYWAKTVGSGKEKIKSVAQRPDGYLCRVNQTFRDSMKEFLKETRERRHSEEKEERSVRMKEKKIKETVERYDRLIKEAEEEKGRSGQVK